MAKRKISAPKRKIAVDERVSPNDNLTDIFRDMLTAEQRGTDKFLDIVTWNIKWFNVKNPDRIARIARIMAEINADIFVLQEIEEGAMEPIAQSLRSVGAGYYKTFYGSNGGDQRVTLMYDQQFARTTTNPANLFEDEKLTLPGTRKLVFPRFPVQAKFSVYATEKTGKQDEKLDPFDFELAGIHLKSQRTDRQGDDGTTQRAMAASRLANWMTDEVDDEDVIVAGDWNAAASKQEFKPIRDLEATGKAHFESFNPSGEASHFFKNGRSSRLDYIVISAAAKAAADSKTSSVLTWDAISKAQTKNEKRNALNWIIDEVSDHLPVVARFYFFDTDAPPN
jgi:endonuclease/exonuclease/phosphatase family metal-dependent hydrolase